MQQQYVQPRHLSQELSLAYVQQLIARRVYKGQGGTARQWRQRLYQIISHHQRSEAVQLGEARQAANLIAAEVQLADGQVVQARYLPQQIV